MKKILHKYISLHNYEYKNIYAHNFSILNVTLYALHTLLVLTLVHVLSLAHHLVTSGVYLTTPV